MKKLVLFLALVLSAVPAIAEEEWLGIYLQGQKIGWTHTVVTEDATTGESRSESASEMHALMLGQRIDMVITSLSRFTKDGRLLRHRFHMESGGRTLKVSAEFGETEIEVEADAQGEVTEKTIQIPEGALIVDDPTQYLASGLTTEADNLYAFDAQSLSLIKFEAHIEEGIRVEMADGKIATKKIVIDDPRAPTTVFLDADGEMLKSVGPLGMEMIPEPMEKAMSLPDGPVQVDIADASSIKPDVPIEDVRTRKNLRLRVTGVDLSHLPSGSHQTVTQDGDGWIVELHPVDPREVKAPGEPSAEQPKEWVEPDFRVPCDAAEFQALAKKLVNETDDPLVAAEAVRMFVHRKIRANAGIAVMRDASEILETEEGVCRDHAVVMASVLRAAEIPTRLVSGLVYQGDRFFYHAWIEVWNGEIWVGFDSTRFSGKLTVGHIKTAQGSVADAFSHFLLDGAKIEVLNEQDG
jgi:hypothetical protein